MSDTAHIKTPEIISELASVAYLAALCAREQIKVEGCRDVSQPRQLRESREKGELTSVAYLDA